MMCCFCRVLLKQQRIFGAGDDVRRRTEYRQRLEMEVNKTIHFLCRSEIQFFISVSEFVSLKACKYSRIIW